MLDLRSGMSQRTLRHARQREWPLASFRTLKVLRLRSKARFGDISCQTRTDQCFNPTHNNSRFPTAPTLVHIIMPRLTRQPQEPSMASRQTCGWIQVSKTATRSMRVRCPTHRHTRTSDIGNIVAFSRPANHGKPPVGNPARLSLHQAS